MHGEVERGRGQNAAVGWGEIGRRGQGNPAGVNFRRRSQGGVDVP